MKFISILFFLSTFVAIHGFAQQSNNRPELTDKSKSAKQEQADNSKQPQLGAMNSTSSENVNNNQSEATPVLGNKATIPNEEKKRREEEKEEKPKK